MMIFLLGSGPDPGLAFLGWFFTSALRVLNNFQWPELIREQTETTNQINGTSWQISALQAQSNTCQFNAILSIIKTVIRVACS